jgi:hypothetical protein
VDLGTIQEGGGILRIANPDEEESTSVRTLDKAEGKWLSGPARLTEIHWF